MAETLSFMVDEIYSTQVGTTMIVSAVVAVWSAAKGTMAIERGLNFMDRTKDTKNYILRRLTNALYTLIFCVMLIALVGVYVLGNTIMEDILAKTNWVDYSEKIFFYSRLLTAPVLVFAVILLIYCRLPDNHLHLKTAIPGRYSQLSAGYCYQRHFLPILLILESILICTEILEAWSLQCSGCISVCISCFWEQS